MLHDGKPIFIVTFSTWEIVDLSFKTLEQDSTRKVPLSPTWNLYSWQDAGDILSLKFGNPAVAFQDVLRIVA